MIKGLGLPDGEVGILELDEMGAEGSAIQDYLESTTGQRTVPSVWIQKEFIGGEECPARVGRTAPDCAFIHCRLKRPRKDSAEAARAKGQGSCMNVGLLTRIRQSLQNNVCIH